MRGGFPPEHRDRVPGVGFSLLSSGTYKRWVRHPKMAWSCLTIKMIIADFVAHEP